MLLYLRIYYIATAQAPAITVAHDPHLTLSSTLTFLRVPALFATSTFRPTFSPASHLRALSQC